MPQQCDPEQMRVRFVIPVFLGGASNVPTRARKEGVEFLYYELKTLKTPLTISIPLAMADNYKTFAVTMFEFERLVRDRSYKAAAAPLMIALPTRGKGRVDRSATFCLCAIRDIRQAMLADPTEARSCAIAQDRIRRLVMRFQHARGPSERDGAIMESSRNRTLREILMSYQHDA
jgi:hypothetical protein